MITNFELVRSRFSVEEYRCTAETGILTEAGHVEVIESEIVQRTLIGQRAPCVAQLTPRLIQALGAPLAVTNVLPPT